MTTTPDLPPAHVDTPEQVRTLRRNKAAARNRKVFARGTRVEATQAPWLPGNGRLGTVTATIPGGNAMGGHINVLWDAPSEFTGQSVVSRMNPTSLLVVDPATGRGILRPQPFQVR